VAADRAGDRDRAVLELLDQAETLHQRVGELL
jgi:hypothetical protein